MSLTEIHTDQNALEVYPHNNTFIHYAMGGILIFAILPVSVLLFPVFLLVKCLWVGGFFVIKNHTVSCSGMVRNVHNRIVTFFHFFIYKCFYFHNVLWTVPLGLGVIPGCWYGLDLSGYKDYDDYFSTFSNSKTRWKFRKHLKDYESSGLKKQCYSGGRAFFFVLSSPIMFKLIIESSFRKNRGASFWFSLFFIFREYLLLLFLPARLCVYSTNDRVIGFSTYLKRGNTMTLCQSVMSNSYTRVGLYFEQINEMFALAFQSSGVRYVSCGISSDLAKKSCGLRSINYLKTDEFRFLPFSKI